MDFTIRCISDDTVYCPRCGSTRIAARNKSISHCGNCGSNITIVHMDKAVNTDESGDFTQLSLFEV